MGQIRRVICEDHTAGAPDNACKPRPEASSCDANPWPGRAQRRTPKAQPQSETAQTMPSTKPRRQVKPQTSLKHNWGTKRTFPKPRRLAPPPKKSHKGNPSYNKLHANSQHKYGAVYAFPPRWTCPRLPTDMDMSMPPPDVDLSMPLHNYGPA